MNDMQLTVSFASIFIAVLLRTLLPSIEKLQAGQKWDQTYTATAALAIITSFASAAATFQAFTIPTGTTSILVIILISFLYGWGLNDVLNTSIVDLPAASTTPATTPTTPKPLANTGSTTPFTGSIWIPDGAKVSLILTGGIAIPNNGVYINGVTASGIAYSGLSYPWDGNGSAPTGSPTPGAWYTITQAKAMATP